MNQRLIDVGIRRGRLLERIATQRAQLNDQLSPVVAVLDAADLAVARVRTASDFARRHPTGIAAAIALLVLLKPRRAWQWTSRAFVAWRSWRALRQQLVAFGILSARA